MKPVLLLVCAVLFVALVAAGCTTQTPTPVPTTVPATPTATNPIPLTDPALIGTWIYKGGMIAGGTPVISNTQKVTATFNSDGTVTGFSGCNNYNAGYSLGGTTTEFGKTITIGPIASTKMYCADTSNFESSYLKIFQQTITYSITNNKLLLRTSYGDQISYEKS